MKEGDLVIVPMPQADGMIKNRPAIILREMPPFRDVRICGVSTQIQQAVKNFDELISASDEDFVSSRLKKESLIRVSLLVVVPRSKIVGSIGSNSSEWHKQLL
jgi:mRNA interferase MazF